MDAEDDQTNEECCTGLNTCRMYPKISYLKQCQDSYGERKGTLALMQLSKTSRTKALP